MIYFFVLCQKIFCMSEIIHFFKEPYLNASLLNICLEFVAATLGIISVFYARKENILVYPTGIISTVIYVYLLSQWSLYGDLIINIYYTLMSIYGWWVWSRVVDDDNHHLAISRTSLVDKIKTLGIFAFSSAFIIGVYHYYEVIPADLGVMGSIKHVYNNALAGDLEKFRTIIPFLDTFTTGAAFAAMWLMANKKIENWIFWIAVNFVSVPLYFIKGYGFTGVQYFVFLILAIFGYIEWKNRIKI